MEGLRAAGACPAPSTMRDTSPDEERTEAGDATAGGSHEGVFAIGLAGNLALAVLKLGVGWWAGSRALIADGSVAGGMVPKLTTMIDALENGVGEVVILSGVEESALLLELFTDSGVGTLIAQDDA